MSDISVLGLGRMGSALASALVRASQSVSVWNRSPERMHALVSLGAMPAETVTSAVSASPIILICLDSYKTAHQLFMSEVVLGRLSGKVIVQLSTGSPSEARHSCAWFNARGARYLDGAILASPAAIGTADALILYSGDREVFETCQPVLLTLAENTKYVGKDVGHAAALDLAWLIQLFGAFVGAAHGATICETERADITTYSELFPANSSARWFLSVLEKNSLTNPGATMSVWTGALQQIKAHALENNISSQVPDFVGTILDGAIAKGFGEQHIAAITKALGSFKH